MAVEAVAPYLTIDSVAKMLCVSVPTVYSLVKQGKLPKPSKVGRRLLFNSEKVFESVEKAKD
jgi:excisionase family DNA binding protein